MKTMSAATASDRDEKGRAMMSVDDIAAELQCSGKHVRRMFDNGTLPRPIKLGSLIRLSRADFDQWVSDGCPKRRGR